MNALKAGTTLQKGKYTISRVLGAGTFGITYMANTRVQMNGPLGQMDVMVDVAVKEFYMKDINVRTSDGANIEGTQNTLVKDYRHKFRKQFCYKQSMPRKLFTLCILRFMPAYFGEQA